MGDHGYAGLSKPTKPGLSSAPTGMLKEEVLDELEKRLVHDETVHIQPPRKPTAIEIELDMTKPMWRETLGEENQGANEDQLKTLLDLKLEQARQMIPVRWKAEKKFKDDCQMIDQIQANFEQVLNSLQAKESTDPSARIEEHQAKRLIKDWETCRLPQLEANFKDATRVWYKPHRDPLTTTYSTIMNRFANLMARFEYETSIRPALNGSTVDHSTQDWMTKTISVTHPEQPKMEQFRVQDKIKPFEGDLGDPEVMAKFSQWKCDWAALVKEMESLPGFNKISLFEKLKKALSERAFRLVYRYPTKREDSYDKAMQELKNKFENPLNIAAHLIKRGLTPRRTKADQLESVKASLNALQRVKNIFETENVDMYTFALTCTFTRSMTPSMEESWDKFRIQEMHHYHEKRDLGVKAGEFLPEWKFGLVDNYEKFNAWLEKQEAQLKKDDIERRSDQLSSLCRESTNQEEIETPKVDFFCFLCGPKNSNHHLTRCPVGLDMSLKDWVRVCRNVSYCYKCARPLEGNHHQCHMTCRICMGRSKEVDHHVLMCPLNLYRTSPLVQDHDNHRRDRVGSRPDPRKTSTRSSSRASRESPVDKRSRSARRGTFENSTSEEDSHSRTRARSPLSSGRYQRH
ncbi:uncharacterized protein LOC131881749 [Tigriopus californicus]|uniref:uncharacterized protein LOC131881749 n=1 Tax=Tigriopus californicus TaxID=6832 RepID=UPI0027DA5C2B|nr:uncharacterized protein LOC131881749 [Tigriopus californicus]